MRVLNVLLSNYIGGPQNRVLMTAKGLRKYGIETIILSPKGRGDFTQTARDQHFKVYQIMLYGPKHFNSFSSIFENIKWFFTFPASILLIMRIIVRERIDIIQVNGLVNLQAPIAGFILRKKVVWYLSSSLFPKAIVNILMPLVLFISTHIVIIANGLESYYFGDKKIENLSVITRSIDASEFDPQLVSESDRMELRAELNISSNQKIIGCVGNVEPTKGYEYFIEAAMIIKGKLNDAKFVIVGDLTDSQRPYQKKLRDIISYLNLDNDIIFAGKRFDIPQLLSLYDVFVLSSISEGGPAVALEAMSMEKPVVATNVGIIPEYIISGNCGIIVNIKNPQAIADAVIFLLNNPEERERMGRAARKRIESLSPFDDYIRKHRDVYFNALGGVCDETIHFDR